MVSFNFHQLIIRDLSFERNYTPLFTQLSLTCASRQLVQIHGQNGSGKSTLLRLIAGLLQPQTGTLAWYTEDCDNPLVHYQQHINYVGHQNALKSYLTVLENLQLYATLYATCTPVAEIHRILRKFKLERIMHVYAAHISAGQAKRAAFACLSLQPKPLLILDEPFASLDRLGQQLFLEMINTHLERNGSAIIATHDPLLTQHFTHVLHL